MHIQMNLPNKLTVLRVLMIPLFVLFMLVPLMLVVVPRLVEYIDESLLGGFFYRGNLLLRMVPTV